MVHTSRRNRHDLVPPWQTDFPRRDGRACRDQLAGSRVPRDRRPAAMGSVGWKPEKLHRNDARRGNCTHAVSPPSVYHSGLSQAPHPMHRRRFPFSAPPMSDKGRKFLGRQGESFNARMTCLKVVASDCEECFMVTPVSQKRMY